MSFETMLDMSNPAIKEIVDIYKEIYEIYKAIQPDKTVWVYNSVDNSATNNASINIHYTSSTKVIL
jgi:hypothetical protein